MTRGSSISVVVLAISLAFFFVGTSLAFLPICWLRNGNYSHKQQQTFQPSHNNNNIVILKVGLDQLSSSHSSGNDDQDDDDDIRQAYDRWRFMHNKGDFDPSRYENFKTNYKNLIKSNKIVTTKAIQEGKLPPSNLENDLDEYGDQQPSALETSSGKEQAAFNIQCNEEREIKKRYVNWDNPMFKKTNDEMDLSGHFEKPLDDFQDFSSSGHNDAVESVITDFDDHDDHISEEVIKEEYNKWCNIYGKQYNESRLETFGANYKDVAQYYSKTGKSVILNEYADLTAEEYTAFQAVQQQEQEQQLPSSSSEDNMQPLPSKKEEDDGLSSIPGKNQADPVESHLSDTVAASLETEIAQLRSVDSGNSRTTSTTTQPSRSTADPDSTIANPKHEDSFYHSKYFQERAAEGARLIELEQTMIMEARYQAEQDARDKEEYFARIREENESKRLEELSKAQDAIDEAKRIKQAEEKAEQALKEAKEIKRKREEDEEALRAKTAAEEEARRKEVEEEAARLEAQQKKEEDIRIKAAEEEARRKEEEGARRIKAAEKEAKRKEEEESCRMRAAKEKAKLQEAEKGASRMKATKAISDDSIRTNAEAYAKEKATEVERAYIAYSEWCEEYDKEFSEERLQVFTENWRKVQRYEEQTGKVIKLNDQADLTKEESNAVLITSSESMLKPTDTTSSQSSSPSDVRVIYDKWCQHYGKTPSEWNFPHFLSTYLQIEHHFKTTGVALDLDQFADLSPEERVLALEEQQMKMNIDNDSNDQAKTMDADMTRDEADKRIEEIETNLAVVKEESRRKAEEIKKEGRRVANNEQGMPLQEGPFKMGTTASLIQSTMAEVEELRKAQKLLEEERIALEEAKKRVNDEISKIENDVTRSQSKRIVEQVSQMPKGLAEESSRFISRDQEGWIDTVLNVFGTKAVETEPLGRGTISMKGKKTSPFNLIVTPDIVSGKKHAERPSRRLVRVCSSFCFVSKNCFVQG